MKKLLIATWAALALLACHEEETPPPPPAEPQVESTVVRLVSNAWDPYYSPDSKKIVFVEANHLATYDLATKQKQTITPDFGSQEFCPRAPVWLAGDTVAFVRKDETTSAYKIWTVPATGGTVTGFNTDLDPDSSLAGDATARYVYYTSFNTRLLWRLDLQTGVSARVTSQHAPGYGQFDVAVKPDTNYLYFLERVVPFDGSPHAEYLSQVAATGPGAPWILLNTDRPFLPNLTVSPDDTYLVYGNGDGLYAYRADTGEETWLTRAPGNWADKDRYPCYAPDGRHIVFTRNGNVYRCDAP